MRRFVVAPVVVLVLGACGAEDPTTRVNQPGPLTSTFPLSDFFAPSGHMGDGENAGFLDAHASDAWCKPRPAGARGDCYRFTYVPGAYRWAGVYWVFPANNWGSRPGRSIDGARFRQVRFVAAADADDLPVNFIVGGIADPTLPNRDRVSAQTSVRVGRDWQACHLDISGQDFNQVIGAFAWSLAYPESWDGRTPVVLYLDDVVWDTSPAPEAGP